MRDNLLNEVEVSNVEVFCLSQMGFSLESSPNKDSLPKTQTLQLPRGMRGVKQLCTGERKRFQDCITPSPMVNLRCPTTTTAAQTQI